MSGNFSLSQVISAVRPSASVLPSVRPSRLLWLWLNASITTSFPPLTYAALIRPAG